MEYKKIIEQTDRYDIVQWEFQGMPITFRLWKDGSGIVEIKNEMFGGVPEWIRASPDGEFIFVGINPILFN